MKNDGVQFAFGHCWFLWNGQSFIGWLPPLYPHVWTIYFDAERKEVAIALREPDDGTQEKWTEVSKGKWSEMWPVFLVYVQMVYNPEG